MVKRFLELIEREIGGLHEAAYLLGFFAFLSQLLGFLRDRLLVSQFGAGTTLDMYYAAFRVPDFIFILSASMVSLAVLIPMLSRKMSEGKESARLFLDTLFSVFFLFMLVLSAFAFVVAPHASAFLFPGFDATQLETVVLLMRIMLLQPILLAISNLYGSVTQLERRFFVYAMSPILYNIGIIIGVVFFYPVWGLTGLALGVVLGGVLHLSIQIPVIVRSGFLPRFTVKIHMRDIFEVVRTSLPRTLALSAQNISVLALTAIGTLLSVGSVSIFNLSWNLQAVPLSIIGASYSVAAFPTLSALWIAGKQSEFIVTLYTAVRHILFWSLPALVLFVVLRAQIVRTVLGSGAFDWNDTRLTAACLALFALSVVAQSLILLFTRAFYASGRTLVPVLISIVGAGITVGGAFYFSNLFETMPSVRYFFEFIFRVADVDGTNVLMLPFAYSLGSMVSALLFICMFTRHFARPTEAVFRTFGESIVSSVMMGIVAYFLLNIFDDVVNIRTTAGIFSQGLFAGLGGIAVGVFVLWALGNVEIREMWKALHHKIWKAKFIGPDPTDTSF